MNMTVITPRIEHMQIWMKTAVITSRPQNRE